MTPVNLGFMTPYSSIYPHFASHLTVGFYLGIDQDPRNNPDVQFVPDFAGTGSLREVEAVAKKLLQFNNVDILSGMINYRALPSLMPIVSNWKKMAFFFDMGELMPPSESLGRDFFFNSLQLYQSQYALGYWAQKEYKNPGHIVMPIYNSGFILNAAFQQGIAAAGGSTLLQSVIQYKEDDPHHLDIEPIMDTIRKEKPAFVHALFVGPQGNEFLEHWKKETWTRDIPLLVAENMLYDDMLVDIANLGLELYGATSWNSASEDKHNQLFTKKFKELTGQEANIYALLGYEAGLLFKEWIPVLRKKDWDLLRECFAKTEIQSPRGVRRFTHEKQLQRPEIDIIKVKCENNLINRFVIDHGETMADANGLPNPIETELESGWVNPYLCI